MELTSSPPIRTRRNWRPYVSRSWPSRIRTISSADRTNASSLAFAAKARRLSRAHWERGGISAVSMYRMRTRLPPATTTVSPSMTRTMRVCGPWSGGLASSLRNSGRHGRSDLVVQHQIGDFVHFCGVAVDDRQAGSLSLGQQGKARRWIDHQR